MVNGQPLATMVTSSQLSSGQDKGLVGLGMATSYDYNLFSFGQVLEFLGGPSVGIDR